MQQSFQQYQPHIFIEGPQQSALLALCFQNCSKNVLFFIYYMKIHQKNAKIDPGRNSRLKEIMFVSSLEMKRADFFALFIIQQSLFCHHGMCDVTIDVSNTIYNNCEAE